MYIIVGLGNPGREYDNTRHNIGFATIDRIAEKENIDVSEKKHKALTGCGYIEGQRVILAKPQTFMNLSGESVKQIVDYYKADEKNELIVIVDDISLDAGHIRVRKRGSAGGHNGLKSIIAQLGHDNFVRIKIGIGERPEEYNLADYVLGHFSADERKLMEEASESAYNALRMIITEDAEAAMNSFNRKNIL